MICWVWGPAQLAFFQGCLLAQGCTVPGVFSLPHPARLHIRAARHRPHALPTPAALCARAAHRYRAVSGACMRCVRLDLLLLVVSQLGELPKSRYVCSEEEAKEVDECVGALSRWALLCVLCSRLGAASARGAGGRWGRALARVLFCTCCSLFYYVA